VSSRLATTIIAVSSLFVTAPLALAADASKLETLRVTNACKIVTLAMLHCPVQICEAQIFKTRIWWAQTYRKPIYRNAPWKKERYRRISKAPISRKPT